MRAHGVRRFVLTLAAAAALCASPSAAKDKWIAVRTPHLNIVGSAGEGATRKVAEQLERFVDGLGAFAGTQIAADVPVTVVAFKNDAAYRPFRPRQNGRTLDVVGYFQRADDEHLIALSLETGAHGEPFRVIFHEYAHALMARSSVLWPLWLQEGMAEFYSAFQADGRRFTLGDWIREHPPLLTAQRLLPIRELFAVDLNSPTYRGSNQDIFYAQSWLLTHYFMAGDGGRRRASLDQFVNGLSAGQSVERSFADAFRTDEITLQDELKRYLAAGRYIGASLALQRPAPRVTSAVRVLSDAEAEVSQGSLLMRVGRGDEADAYFARARALDPKAPRLEESEGFLALSRARYAEAAEHLRQAIAQDPQNPLAHYYYAETLRREEMEQGRVLSPARARAMADPLRSVIALNPSFVRAYYLLGYAHVMSGDDLPEGVRALETAIRLAPPHRAAMLTLASVQLKMRAFAAARLTAQAIVDAHDATPVQKSEARLIVESAEQSLPR
jgi:tetratricopeptide (TPR) repeat protein